MKTKSCPRYPHNPQSYPQLSSTSFNLVKSTLFKIVPKNDY